MKITMMSEIFEDNNGKKVEGITLILDGVIKDTVEILGKTNGFSSNLEVMQQVIIEGVNVLIKKEK